MWVINTLIVQCVCIKWGLSVVDLYDHRNKDMVKGAENSNTQTYKTHTLSKNITSIPFPFRQTKTCYLTHMYAHLKISTVPSQVLCVLMFSSGLIMKFTSTVKL